jgi:RimJ/RimL family protein N-acetyltransferase
MSVDLSKWPMSVPVLSDGVVTLRAHTPADLDAMLEMAQDPTMVRWTAVPTPHTREMSEQFALHHVPRGWDDGTARGWAIEVDGRYAGNLDVRAQPIADIGFALHPAARGRGVVTRAVRLAVDWCLNHTPVEVVHWRAHVGNEASLRVAHATGFTLHGTTRGILHERGRVLDAWTGSIRFGDAPLPRTPWVGSEVIESGRLRLRPFGPGDLDRVVEACSDPVSRHWLADLPSPYTPAVAEQYLAECAWNAATGTKATWCVADRASDRLLGNVAVMDLRGISGEVGYWLHPDARGRGVMTEAVGLVVDHAWSVLGRERLTLYAAAGNTASNAVARAAGFTPYGTQHRAETLGDGTHDDLVGYELLKPS